MLQFSRRADSHKVPAALSEILEQTLDLAANDYDLKKKYDFRSIEILRDFAPDVPLIPVVVSELEQVLLNLLENAAHAMQENPPDRPPRLTLRIWKEAGYGVLEVEDNGPGLDEASRRRIFEPFFTTKGPGLGTGLGLSVSYVIITQNHKGLLEVDSAPNQGARFTIRLPLDEGNSRD
jgi:signal transduction histidine kinase